MKRISALTLVLFFGMVSCQSEKKSTDDPFRIQEPQIVLKKPNDVNSFTNFTKKPKPDLTLGDEIHFQPSDKSFDLLYSTFCSFDKKLSFNQGMITRPKQIKFLSFLSPEQLRRVGENKDGVSCSFDFVAINQAGSRHHFKLSLVQIRDDELAAEISLINPKQSSEIKEISFEAWHEHFIKLVQSGESKISLNCSTGEKTIDINQSERLSLNMILLQDLKLDWSLEAQTCRFNQIKNSNVIATSKNFTLLSQRIPLKVDRRLGQHPFQAWEMPNPYTSSPSYYLNIKNPYPYTIRLYLPEQEIRQTESSNTEKFMSKIMFGYKGSKNAEWKMGTIIEVEPQETLSLAHYMFFTADQARIFCRSGIFHYNNIRIEQLSETRPSGDKLVLEKIEIPPYSIPRQGNNEYPVLTGSCR